MAHVHALCSRAKLQGARSITLRSLLVGGWFVHPTTHMRSELCRMISRGLLALALCYCGHGAQIDRQWVCTHSRLGESKAEDEGWWIFKAPACRDTALRLAVTLS